VSLEVRITRLAKYVRKVLKDRAPARGRSCGGCDLCCTLLRVAADEWKEPKLSYDSCLYLSAHRCTIYGRRPEVCRTYLCSWRDGSLPDGYSPQKTGIVVNVEAFMGKPMWIAYLSYPDAHKTPIGTELLSGLLSAQLMPLVAVKRRFWDEEHDQFMKEILVCNLDGEARPFICPEEPGDEDGVEGPSADWFKHAAEEGAMVIRE
jgi:hypothetical protein